MKKYHYCPETGLLESVELDDTPQIALVGTQRSLTAGEKKQLIEHAAVIGIVALSAVLLLQLLRED